LRRWGQRQAQPRLGRQFREDVAARKRSYQRQASSLLTDRLFGCYLDRDEELRWHGEEATMRAFILIMVSAFLVSCDTDRVSHLEKQVKDLEEKSKVHQSSAELEMQARCAKDAKAWFSSNWTQEKDTLFLDFTNHYNRAENRCYIRVEHHTAYAPKLTSDWFNHLTIYNVYENNEVAQLTLVNRIRVNEPNLKSEIISCTVYGETCKSPDEFYAKTNPFMQN
jgi:hypothetical protein